MKKSAKEKLPKKKTARKARRLIKLEKATAAYFDSLNFQQIEEGNRLEMALASASAHVDFGEEP